MGGDDERGRERVGPDVPNAESGTVATNEPLAACDPDLEHLRLLFEHMLEGYAYCRIMFDAEGRPDDFAYVDVNPAFGRLTGLTDVEGKRVTEVIPGIRESNPEVFDIYGRVTKTGVPERFETQLDQLGVVLSISVFKPEEGHFVAVFEDVTERRRAERKLEELVKFLEYRVEERTNDLAEALGLIDRTREGARSGDAER